jgi:hypothetical protein
MRIFVATVGTEPYHIFQRERFVALAAADEVGDHRAADSAADADAVLFVDLQQHPGDAFLRRLRRHPLALRYPEKICVYDERDDPFVSFPGIYVSGTLGLARRRAIVGGTYPWLQTVIPRTPDAPDLLFSFSGARTHPCRGAVLALEHPRAEIRDTTGSTFFGWSDDAAGARTEAARAEYASTVVRSKFVLCPRGHGPSSFRLYETLAAGRVPVVISDDWLPPPRIDWSACVVRITERGVPTVPHVLARLEDSWPRMACAAAATFDENFAESRLWNHYATSIQETLCAARPSRWWTQREVFRIGVRRLRGTARAIAQRPSGGS